MPFQSGKVDRKKDLHRAKHRGNPCHQGLGVLTGVGASLFLWQDEGCVSGLGSMYPRLGSSYLWS